MDRLTFGLALLAYAALGLEVLRAPGRGRWLPAVVAALATAHVLCVWALRFEWSFERAFVGRIPGFVLFHAALGLILAAPFARARSGLLARVAFGIVSVGAVAATFRYEVVHALRVPTLAIAVGTPVTALVLRRRRAGDGW